MAQEDEARAITRAGSVLPLRRPRLLDQCQLVALHSRRVRHTREVNTRAHDRPRVVAPVPASVASTRHDVSPPIWAWFPVSVRREMCNAVDPSPRPVTRTSAGFSSKPRGTITTGRHRPGDVRVYLGCAAGTSTEKTVERSASTGGSPSEICGTSSLEQTKLEGALRTNTMRMRFRPADISLMCRRVPRSTRPKKSVRVGGADHLQTEST
jgi:hypothetical protein